jgi:hypothetical protein
VQRLREQLIAITLQSIDIDCPDLDGPEPPTARLIAQVNVLVRGANENALPWLVLIEPAIGGAISLLLAGQIGLKPVCGGAGEAV